MIKIRLSKPLNKPRNRKTLNEALDPNEFKGWEERRYYITEYPHQSSYDVQYINKDILQSWFLTYEGYERVYYKKGPNAELFFLFESSDDDLLIEVADLEIIEHKPEETDWEPSWHPKHYIKAYSIYKPLEDPVLAVKEMERYIVPGRRVSLPINGYEPKENDKGEIVRWPISALYVSIDGDEPRYYYQAN